MLLRDLGVELLALGDVLVRADQTPAGHRHAHHRNRSPVCQPDDRRNLLLERLDALSYELLRVDIRIETRRRARLKNFAKRRSWLHLLRR